MSQPADSDSALRIGRNGAVMLLLGAFLSGIVSQLVVAGVHAPPPWHSAADFAAHFRPIEVLPYFYGFALVAGGVMVIAACHRLSAEAEKPRTLIAVMLAAAFAAVTGFNHLTQVTFIPEMARDFQPGYDAALSAFAMGNPRSLAWTMEVWGYTLFGLATWLIAPLFRRDALERVARTLLVLNGVVGVIGGLLTAADMGWAMTVPGMVSYLVWNALIVLMAAAVAGSLHRRLVARAAATSQPAA